ncbi:hypothetical protein ACA910_004256 [Epithemia clementina (nom. ined.)]
MHTHHEQNEEQEQRAKRFLKIRKYLSKVRKRRQPKRDPKAALQPKIIEDLSSRNHRSREEEKNDDDDESLAPLQSDDGTGQTLQGNEEEDALDDALLEDQESVLHYLNNLQNLIEREASYKLFKGLCRDVDNFSDAFGLCMDQISAVKGNCGLAAIVKHLCTVGRFFIKRKMDEIGAIDTFFMPLLAHGFKVQLDSEVELPFQNEADPPTFLVIVDSLNDEGFGAELSSKLNSLSFKCSHMRKRPKWWSNSNYTRQLSEALNRKKSNDAGDIGFQYIIGSQIDTARVSCLDENDDFDDDEVILYARKSNKWFPWKPPVVQPDHVFANSETTKIDVHWNPQPGVGVDTDKHLVILSELDNPGNPGRAKKQLCDSSSCTFTDLVPNTEYSVEVRFVSGIHGASTECIKLTVLTQKVLSLANKIKKCIVDKDMTGVGEMRENNKLFLFSSIRSAVQGKGIHLPGEPTVDYVREVDVMPDFEPDVGFGEVEHATVLVLTGETGAGKSTLINAIINWLYGVSLEDPFRLVLVDDSQMDCTRSVTQHITAYYITSLPGMPITDSLIIVDSPGFADTRNLTADEFTTNCFRQLFQQIKHVNCVGLVMKANNEKLTDTTKYVIEKMLGLFHISIKDNILPICTFADHAQPMCLKGLQKDNVPFQYHVKVQNSLFSCRYQPSVRACLASVSELRERKLYFDLAYHGIANLFDIVSNRMKVRQLHSSSSVLELQRQLQEQLHTVLHALSGSTTETANIMQQLSVLVNILGQAPTEKIVIRKSESTMIDLLPGVHVTLCRKCNVTCHENCTRTDDNDKENCCAMDSKGNCMICPGRCSWRYHHNARYKWEVRTTSEEVVPTELIERWAGAKGSHELAILKGLERLHEKQRHVAEILRLAVNLKKQLAKQRLRDNPGVALAYVESLIQMQKDLGAGDDVLKALHQAKKHLRLEDECQVQREIHLANEGALNCIKEELSRRSVLDPEQRLQEEKSPNDIYNRVLDHVPEKYRSRLPPRLKRSDWYGGQPYPPFRESLLRTGQALAELIRLGLS